MARDRLLVVVPSLAGGGAERVAVELSAEFARRGHEVALAVFSNSGVLLPAVDGQVDVVVLEGREPWGHCRALARLIRLLRPVAVLSLLSHTNVITAAACLLSRVRCRLVCSEHACLSRTIVEYGGWRLHLTKLLLHGALRACDRVVVVSDGVGEDLERTLRLPKRRICRIYNPVLSERLLEAIREPVQHPWLGAGGPPLIVAAGRLTPQKDYPTLLRAFAILRARRQARLLILGDGECRHALLAEIQRDGLVDCVQLAGYVSNPLPYMAAASVFVLSSRFEGLGNVLIEAMACGTAVVATDCPSGPAEILEGGRWGRLVPVGDGPALASAIEAALDDRTPSDVRQRAAAFSVNAAATQYLQVLLPAAGPAPGSDG